MICIAFNPGQIQCLTQVSTLTLIINIHVKPISYQQSIMLQKCHTINIMLHNVNKVIDITTFNTKVIHRNYVITDFVIVNRHYLIHPTLTEFCMT